jgi:hypothetical protein
VRKLKTIAQEAIHFWEEWLWLEGFLGLERRLVMFEVISFFSILSLEE